MANFVIFVNVCNIILLKIVVCRCKVRFLPYYFVKCEKKATFVCHNLYARRRESVKNVKQPLKNKTNSQLSIRVLHFGTSKKSK
jgi:hypothetical protein